jgi:1-phosphatidylinositol phosphodiesterase
MVLSNKKHWIWAVLVSFFSLSCFGAATFEGGSSLSKKNADWMASYSDDHSLFTLAIPGSHDSGALSSIYDLAGKCQDASIGDQLLMGVRYLDIRFGEKSGNLYVIHGFIDEKQSGENVFSTCLAYLEEHPKEGLLLSVKNEKSGSDNASFEKALQSLIASFGSRGKAISLSKTVPTTLGEIRGKMVLFSRYASSQIGIPCGEGWADPADATSPNSFTLPLSSPIHVQDHYKLKDNDTKWNEIGEAIQHSLQNPNALTLNFTSGYLVSSFPPSYSVSTAKVINPKILASLPSSHPGVYVSDFVSEALTSAILKGNV